MSRENRSPTEEPYAEAKHNRQSIGDNNINNPGAGVRTQHGYRPEKYEFYKD
jgi:hypothetical protein